MNKLDIVLRNRHSQAQQRALREPHDRYVLFVGVGPALNQRASIRVAPHDHAVQWGHDVGVVLECLHTVVVCVGHLRVLLGACRGSFGCIHLRFRRQVFALGIVQFLLRDQTWLGL